jgi:DNA invertase Pin-like site-specific DNA recombinase
VAFIATLMKGVDFLAVDNPHANKFTVHILAAVAEFERDAISKRTKEALAAAKARGVKLGDYARIATAKRKATTARAESVRPAIASTMHLSALAAGCRSQQAQHHDCDRRSLARDASDPRTQAPRPEPLKVRRPTGGHEISGVTSLRERRGHPLPAQTLDLQTRPSKRKSSSRIA